MKFALALWAGAILFASAAQPGPIPDAVRERFHLDPFYQKTIDAGGFPIVGSANVSDAALAEAAWIVAHLLEHRPEIARALGEANVRFAIMAHDEYTTDIPEHADLEPKVYWDRRARGLGATKRRPAVSAAEENLLAFPGDPYPTENIGIHEFAHAIHEMAMPRLDPAFDDRLKNAFRAALERGLWKDTYAAVNRQEYWAEAVQSWFDNNRGRDSLHNGINTRALLKDYDPGVAALCGEVFGDLPWRYQKPGGRAPEERAHPGGFDPAKAPRFHWRKVPVPGRPRISFDCADGQLEFEFDRAANDPARLAEFLGQVHSGFFSDGRAGFGADGVRLVPAEKLPDGEPVPAEAGQWSIRFDSASPARDVLFARVSKGADLAAKLARRSNPAMPIQRIVRQN